VRHRRGDDTTSPQEVVCIGMLSGEQKPRNGRKGLHVFNTVSVPLTLVLFAFSASSFDKTLSYCLLGHDVKEIAGHDVGKQYSCLVMPAI
jgi:hypothetical protein